MRDTLWRDVETELEKSADSIDPDYIDSRINELCEMEARRSGLRPPETSEARINAVINRITARVYRKSPARRLPHLIRLAAVACIAVFFSVFSINYIYAKVSKHCFLKNMNITLCCGTAYCPCIVKKE
jgi:hypothetical protein